MNEKNKALEAVNIIKKISIESDIKKQNELKDELISYGFFTEINKDIVEEQKDIRNKLEEILGLGVILDDETSSVLKELNETLSENIKKGEESIINETREKTEEVIEKLDEEEEKGEEKENTEDDEVTEITKKDIHKKLINIIKPFTKNINKNEEKLIVEGLLSNIKSKINGEFNENDLDKHIEDIKNELKNYLRNKIKGFGESENANTTELEEFFEKTTNWNNERIKQEIKSIKNEVNKKEKEIKKLTEKVSMIKDEQQELTEDINMYGNRKNNKGVNDQIKEKDKKRNELRKETKEINEKINELTDNNEYSKRKLTIISDGTKVKIRNKKGITAESMLMHINAFFYQKENPDVNEDEVKNEVLKRTEKIIKEVNNNKSHTKNVFKFKKTLTTASYDEVIKFLSSDKSTLKLNEENKNNIKELINKNHKNKDELKNWIEAIYSDIEGGNEKEKNKNLENFMVKLIGSLQSTINENRFLKVGVEALSVKKLTILKNNLNNAYREKISEESNDLDEFLNKTENFNEKVLKEQIIGDTKLSNKLKEFLKEHRKDYFSHKATNVIFKKGIWEWGIKKGFWGLGVETILGKGLFQKLIWEKGLKKHPKTIAKTAGWTTAALMFSPVPVGAVFLSWQGIKGVNYLRKKIKGNKLKTNLNTA